MEFWLPCGWPHFFLCVNRISGPEVISDALVQALNCMVLSMNFILKSLTSAATLVPTSKYFSNPPYKNLTIALQVIPKISSEFQKSHQASWLGTAYVAHRQNRWYLNFPQLSIDNLYLYAVVWSSLQRDGA
jgi:hypothetical protein